MTEAVLANLYFIVLVMLVAGLSVLAFRRSMLEWNKRRPHHPIDLPAAREHVARFISAAAIKVLLPTLFLESIIKNADRLKEISVGVLIGGLFAFITLVMGRFLTSLSPKAHIAEVAHVVGATFGGGNRGVALLIIAMLLLGLDKELYLAYFYSVDFGNFLFFLFIVPLYLNEISKDGHEESPSWTAGSVLKLIGIPNIVIIVFVLLMLFGTGDEITHLAEALLAPTARERSFLMLYLSFALIFLQIDIKLTLFAASANFLLITLARALTLLIFWFFLVKLGNAAATSPFGNPYFFSLLILFLCPPSSQVGAQVKEYFGDNAAVEFANTLNVIMVVVYLLFIVVAVSAYALVRT
jgi:hypothetical protein